MVAELSPVLGSQWAAMGRVAELLGIGTKETVRKWVRRANANGERALDDSTESEEVRRLRWENAELRRAKAILKAASALRGRDRPATAVIARFVQEHKDSCVGGLRWGVDPICRVLSEHGLPMAPSTYYEHVTRRPSRREIRDADLRIKVRRLWEANYRVYGARKVWLALNR